MSRFSRAGLGAVVALALASVLAACAAAPIRESAPAAELTTEQDYALMLAALGIESVRPGRDGRDPNSPNYAHYDEASANPFPALPDPLVTEDGRAVTSAAMWRDVRRPEIVELFDREIYGRMPAHVPSVQWESSSANEESIGAVRVLTRRVRGMVDNSAHPDINVNLDLQISVPVDAQGPVPVILNLLWIDPPTWYTPPPGTPDWREEIVARGYGVAVLDPGSVQADNGAGLTRGIIGLVNHGEPRAVDDWGALRAWAWGASRAIDFFESDGALDASRVGIQGHSRYGKAALVAMAYEPRLAVGFISSSGAGGASLLRRDYGEIVENVAGSGEYHWMAGNFIKYAGPLGWDDLPVDAHELIALAAPRPVFISSGAFEGDAWVDARGMFMAADAAGPVYRLLGARDLGTHAFPAQETGLMEGEIAYRQHSAGHTPVRSIGITSGTHHTIRVPAPDRSRPRRARDPARAACPRGR
jgi:hypothetical protein